jgi:hypothetical protein
MFTVHAYALAKYPVLAEHLDDVVCASLLLAESPSCTLALHRASMTPRVHPITGPDPVPEDDLTASEARYTYKHARAHTHLHPSTPTHPPAHQATPTHPPNPNSHTNANPYAPTLSQTHKHTQTHTTHTTQVLGRIARSTVDITVARSTPRNIRQ